MPVLSNPRHERFAQELAKGKSASQAYVAAGLDRRTAKGAEGFYVYLLIDPRDDSVFYIGKGKGRRSAAHWAAMARGVVKNVANHDRLTAIHSEGLRVEEACFADGLSSDAAYALEQALIRTVGFSDIANVLPGVTTQSARTLAEVKANIARIKPYRRWCVEMQPSDEQQRLYWQVVIHYHRLRRRLEAKLGLRCPVVLAR